MDSDPNPKHGSTEADNPKPFDPAAITRPDPKLWHYYIITTVLTIVGVFSLPILYFKYHTLKYRLDDEGIAMSWGILFRREIYLTYRRIQDIHVTRNLIERWLGLASISVQTASGTSGAEMTIIGITEPHRLRDYLYAQMRGVKELGTANIDGEQSLEPDEALVLLREIRDHLKTIRESGTRKS